MPPRVETHCVYILRSLSCASRSYVGYTTDPAHRLRQHNGLVSGGARKTRKHRPWAMLAVISRFGSHTTALQFEWALQHPAASLAVRAAVRARAPALARARSVAAKMEVAQIMMQLAQWRREPVRLHFDSDASRALWARSAPDPPVGPEDEADEPPARARARGAAEGAAEGGAGGGSGDEGGGAGARKERGPCASDGALAGASVGENLANWMYVDAAALIERAREAKRRERDAAKAREREAREAARAEAKRARAEAKGAAKRGAGARAGAAPPVASIYDVGDEDADGDEAAAGASVGEVVSLDGDAAHGGGDSEPELFWEDDEDEVVILDADAPLPSAASSSLSSSSSSSSSSSAAAKAAAAASEVIVIIDDEAEAAGAEADLLGDDDGSDADDADDGGGDEDDLELDESIVQPLWQRIRARAEAASEREGAAASSSSSSSSSASASLPPL